MIRPFTIEDGKVVGTALSGHDGRRGYLYHVCVEDTYRRKSIGRELIEHVIDSMRAEEISRTAIFCLKDNESGNCFWELTGMDVTGGSEHLQYHLG